MQQFEGRSVEDALAAAARQLGDGLTVKSAQRIRRGGILGFFAKEHYQVVAEAAGGFAPLQAAAPQPSSALHPPGAHATDSVDRALRSLVEEVESRELPFVASAAPSRFTDADLARLEPPAPAMSGPAADGRAARPRRERPLKAPAAIEATSAPAETIDLRVEPTAVPTTEPTFYDFEVLDAQEIERAPKWTRTALRDLGLPLPVLKALPQKTPTTDIGWTKALERAIAKVVPPPAPLDEENDAQVSGFGGKGAVNIIRAAISGFTPGLLQIDGRSVPATAAELALGVRSCLRR